MPVHFGKPGTRKYTGRLRAQLQKILVEVTGILNYNTKQAARIPPVVVLSPLNLASCQAMQTTCKAMIAAVN